MNINAGYYTSILYILRFNILYRLINSQFKMKLNVLKKLKGEIYG